MTLTSRQPLLILKSPKKFDKTEKEPVKILSVGFLEQMYKAPDIAVDAIELLRGRGFNCYLTWVGDGLYRKDMIDYVSKKGLEDYIDFKGKVLPTKVREHLLESDIFILISRTEGLPRAIIEAMGAGLPCIGTRVGGIPELLEADVLVEPDNAKAVADKIEAFIVDKDFANRQAQRNLIESDQYKESVLRKKREDFYQSLIEIAE